MIILCTQIREHGFFYNFMIFKVLIKITEERVFPVDSENTKS